MTIKKNSLLLVLSSIVLFVTQIRYAIVTMPSYIPEYISLFDNYFSVFDYLTLRILGSVEIIFSLVIFIYCIYFFNNDKNVNIKKILKYYILYLLISIVTLLLARFFGYELNEATINKCLMPIINQNIQVISFAFVLYLVNPFLSKILERIGKPLHFCLAIISFILFFVIDFFFPFSLNIKLYYLSIYIIYSYINLYCNSFNKNIKKNLIISLVCILVLCFLYFYKLYIKDIKIPLYLNNNPLCLIIAICLFNLLNTINFNNKFLDSIAMPSILACFINYHIIFRNYFDVEIIAFVYKIFGQDYILIKLMFISLLLCVTLTLLVYVFISLYNKITKIEK